MRYPLSFHLNVWWCRVKEPSSDESTEWINKSEKIINRFFFCVCATAVLRVQMSIFCYYNIWLMHVSFLPVLKLLFFGRHIAAGWTDWLGYFVSKGNEITRCKMVENFFFVKGMRDLNDEMQTIFSPAERVSRKFIVHWV